MPDPELPAPFAVSPGLLGAQAIQAAGGGP